MNQIAPNYLGTALGGIAAGGWAPQQNAECRMPEIESQIQTLSREASEIAAFIDSLENRFHKVLQPSPPANQTVGENTPYHTVLGGELGELVERLRISRVRLESILQRAEL